MPTWRSAAAGRWLILAGALLGVGLILYGIWSYSRPKGEATKLVAGPSPAVTQVVTAARPLVRGQLIQAEDLTTTSVLGAAPPGALTSPGQAGGRIAIADIQPRQLILASLVSAEAGAAGLALLIPAGQRAISIDTTDEIAVGGFVRPGDIVDVEIFLPQDAVAGQSAGPNRSESRTLLQNISVLTVGATLGPPGGKDADGKERAPARTMTLVMNPDQVAPFVLARKLGQFYLLLRNPGDRGVLGDNRAVLASLRGGAAPAAPRTAVTAAVRSRPAAPRAIEVIVGGQRQIVYPGAGAQ